MGKIKVRTLGDEILENKQKEKAKQKSKEKKLVKGTKGGERIVSVGPTEEELAKLEVSKDEKASEASSGIKIADKQQTTNNKRQARVRSKNYQTVAKMVDKTKNYTLTDALTLLAKIHLSKFDETVELHINTTQPSVSVTTTLPHGTGKKVRVVIADDTVIENVAKGKIDFDVLLAEPSMMPKLAKVARFLGPRGLMPNPKSGTISNNPRELAKKFEGGQITFKTEAKSPIMHLTVGKMSFGDKKLAENVTKAIEAIKSQNIKNITLKSTMSPGIKIKIG